MSFLYSQYASMKSWAVETDIMNMIYSRGLIGFAAFLGFLAQIIAKGCKRDFRYVTIPICFLAAGITYNVQFSWVFFLEILLLLSLEQDINIFGKQDKGRRFFW